MRYAEKEKPQVVVIGKELIDIKEIVRIMINEWGIKNIGWLGYKVSRDNPYTYHHIKKRSHGGKEEIKNGAILTDKAHRYLHIVESRDKELYEYINLVLKQINEQGFNALERQLLAIDYFLKQFEREHEKDRSKKGKVLIKEEYKKRYLK